MKKTSDNETNVIMQNQEKLNKCSQCGYASAHESALRGHLKIHKVEKSNVHCAVCVTLPLFIHQTLRNI